MSRSNPARGKSGWLWFEGEPEKPHPRDPSGEGLPDVGLGLATSYARCFATPDGEKVLAHLKSMTLERALGPAAEASVLRHTEGQRQLVAYLLAQVRRGQNPV